MQYQALRCIFRALKVASFPKCDLVPWTVSLMVEMLVPTVYHSDHSMAAPADAVSETLVKLKKPKTNQQTTKLKNQTPQKPLHSTFCCVEAILV